MVYEEMHKNKETKKTEVTEKNQLHIKRNYR